MSFFTVYPVCGFAAGTLSYSTNTAQYIDGPQSARSSLEATPSSGCVDLN